MKLRLLPLALVTFFAAAAPAAAQSLGTFRWQLEPFGSVLSLNVVQQGSVYLLNGFELQCSNPSLPAWGVAVPQANGTVMLGITTITADGHGLHTRASINLSDFSGGWVDNGNQSGFFTFNPGDTCAAGGSTGPRIDPIDPDQAVAPNADATAAAVDALKAEMDLLRSKMAELEAKKR